MPMMNTIGNSRPLALCSVISVTRPSSSRIVSASASSAICCRNSPSVAALGRVRVVLARDAHELVEVLQPALGLDRPLGLQRLPVARSRRASPRAACATGAPASARSLAGACIVSMKRSSALRAAVAEPGDVVASAASQTVIPIAAACASTRDSDVCPIPRRGELAIRVNAVAVLRVDQERAGTRSRP